MKYHRTTLKNGIRAVCVPMEGMESATVTVWVKVGSRQEADRIAGLSHFLEHMAFKGSKKRPSAKQISEVIDGIGGVFNASTSKEWTNFYIKARADNLDIVMDVLSDMLIDPILDADEMEKEKGVITEEIAMYEDTPMMNIGDVYEELIYRGNTLGRDTIGSKKTVQTMKRSDFINFRKKHYFGKNILITISGGVDQKIVDKLTKKYFSRIPQKGTQQSIQKFIKVQKTPQVLLKSKTIEQAHFILGFLGNRMGHEDRFAESMLSIILGGGMSSRLFLEVREKRGLAYAVRTSSDHYIDTGELSTYVGADLSRVDEAIKVVADQMYGLAAGKYPTKSKELDKAKEYLKGRLALGLEDTQAVNAFVGIKELLLGKIETPDEIYKQVDKVTVDDVYRVAKKFFVPERLNLALIGPYKNKKRFEKLVY